MPGGTTVDRGASAVIVRGWVIAVACVAGVAAAAPGEDAKRLLPDGGGSSRQARADALRQLPLERLPAAQRNAVEDCVRDSTLYRRLPALDIDCDTALLHFALDKPEVVVDIWRALGISQLSLDPTGPGQWHLADGYGTVGVLRLLHARRDGNGGLLVFHGRGRYTGSLAPRPLTGSCVIVVRHGPVGTTALGHRHRLVVDAFVDMDGIGLELVTRTLQPLVVRCAAANLREIGLFMEALSTTAIDNPAGVERLAGRLPRTPDEDRRSLARIARRAAAAAGAGGAGDDHESAATRLAARWKPAPPQR